MSEVRETILADVQVKGLDNFGKLKVSMDTVAKSSETAAKGLTTLKAQAANAAKQLGVNTKIGKRFVNTALNAGFAAEDQAKAMAKIKEVAEKTGKPVEIIEKAWEGLARTLQNAEEATENLEDALRFQARAGIPEAEKAAAKYAQTIGGGTDALKGLTGVGEMYAKQLDQIRDADLKAKLTTELARKELNRKRESIERVKDSYNAMSLRMKAALGPSNLLALKMMTKGIKILAAAVGAALVGAFALAVKSIREFIKTDEVMKAKLDVLKKAVLDLQIALGSALVGGSKNAGKAFDELTGKVQTLTQWINTNAETIFEFSKSIVSAFATALEWGAKLILGFKLVGGAITDVVELMVSTATWGLAQVAQAGRMMFNEVIRAAQQMLDGLIMLADKLGPNLVPDGVRDINLHGLLTDLGDLEALAATASDRMSQGFVNAQAALSDANKLDVLIQKLREMGEASLSAVVAPKTPGAPGKAGKDKDDMAWAFAPDPTQELEKARFDAEMARQLALQEEFAALEQQTRDSEQAVDDFSDTIKTKIGGVALKGLEDFGNGAAQAFGIAMAGGKSFGAAIGDLMKQTVGQMAVQLGQYFVLKGAAITVDPLLGGPALGVPIIAAGLTLQAFGASIGFQKGGGPGSSAASAAPSVSAAPAFQPREQEQEKPEETTIVINIAGETIGPAIWDAMNEGVRLGHVAQLRG